MTTVTCQHCGKVFESQRRTRKFCSVTCANRSIHAVVKERNCRHCGAAFPVISSADANRQHCSRACAKNYNALRIHKWKEERPGYMKPYNETRKAKDPEINKRRAREQRAEILRLLGGACVVCGASNPNWLHVDYIPTQKDLRFRHPRHIKFVREHLSEFRILCANHHYELTLTGAIEGTDITQ